MSFYLPRDEKLDMQLYLVGSSNLNTTQIWKLFNINYRDRADSDVFPCFSPKSDLSYLFTSFIALDIVYCGICTSSTLKNCNCGICTSSTSKKLCIAASVQVVHWKIVYWCICTSCLSAFYTLTILRKILIALLVHIRSIIFFYVLLIMFFFLFLNYKLVWDYFSSFQFILTLPSFFSRSQIEPVSLQNFVWLLEFLQYLTNRTRFFIEFCSIVGISPISHK